MRVFTQLVSLALGGVGVWMIKSGEAFGWLLCGLLFACFMIASLERYVGKRCAPHQYRVLITKGGIFCERPWRKRESIRWEDVNRVWHVTTAALHVPDEWVLLEGDKGRCSFPTEATGIEALWDELEQRFPGFDYGPLKRGGTNDARHLCWEKPAA